MMRSTPISRRLLLAAIVPAIAAPILAWAARFGAAPRGRLDVSQLLSDRRGARAIGARYLAEAPQEAAPGFLKRCLLSGDAADACGAADLDRLRRALDQRRRSDFASGDTVLIDGWIMARTEARLCALALLG